jgi:hypothetical protein
MNILTTYFPIAIHPTLRTIGIPFTDQDARVFQDLSMH